MERYAGYVEPSPEAAQRQARVEARQKELDQMSAPRRLLERVKTGYEQGAQSLADTVSRLGDIAGGVATGDFRPLAEQVEGAGRGLYKLAGAYVDPTGRAAAAQTPALTRLQQRQATRRRAGGDLAFIGGEVEKGRLAEEAEADPTLTGGVVRGVTSGAISTLPYIAAGAAGAGPAALGGLAAAQSDFTRPEEAATNIAGAVLPVKASRMLTPAIERQAARLPSAFQAPARGAGQIGIGGGTNIAQAAATGETDPQKLAEAAIVGGVLSGQDAYQAGRRSALPTMSVMSAPEFPVRPRPPRPTATPPMDVAQRRIRDPRPLRQPVIPQPDAVGSTIQDYVAQVEQINRAGLDPIQRRAALEQARNAYRASREAARRSTAEQPTALPPAPVANIAEPQTGRPATMNDAGFAAEFERLSAPGGRPAVRAAAIETLRSQPQFRDLAAELQAAGPEERAGLIQSLPRDLGEALMQPVAAEPASAALQPVATPPAPVESRQPTAPSAAPAKVKAGAEIEVFRPDESPEYDPETQKIVTFRGRDRQQYVAVVPKGMRRDDAITFGRARTPEVPARQSKIASPPIRPAEPNTAAQPESAPTAEAPVPRRTFRVGDEDVELTPEQATRWQAEVVEPLRKADELFKERMRRVAEAKDAVYAARLEDQANKDRKATAFQVAARKREIAGKETATERAAKAKRAASNFAGKEVGVNVRGEVVRGKVLGTVFGRTRVRLESGEELSVPRERITEPPAPKREPEQPLTPPEPPPLDERFNEPVEAPSIPAIKAARQPVSGPTDSNIEQFRGRLNELSRLEANRRGEMPVDLRDELSELRSKVIQYEQLKERNERGRLDEAPPARAAREPLRQIPAERMRSAFAQLEETAMRDEAPAEIGGTAKEKQNAQLPEATEPVDQPFLGGVLDDQVAGLKEMRRAQLDRFIAEREKARNDDIRGIREMSSEEAAANARALNLANEEREARVKRGEMPAKFPPRPSMKPFTREEGVELMKRPVEEQRAIVQERRARDLREAGNTSLLNEDLGKLDDAALQKRLSDIEQVKQKNEGNPEYRGLSRRRQAYEERVRREVARREKEVPEPATERPANEIEQPPAEATGRPIQHYRYGRVTESPNQRGVGKGRLRVVGEDGVEHVIRNPRIAGNREAAFVKSEPASEKPKSEPANYWKTESLPLDETGNYRQLSPEERDQQFQNVRAEFRRHATRGRLYTNEQGAISYAKALQKATGQANFSPEIDGVAIPLNQAAQTLRYLKKLSKESTNPQRKPVLESMATELGKAVDDALGAGRPGVVITTTQAKRISPETGMRWSSFEAARQTAAHEETHLFQHEFGFGEKGKGQGLFDDETITSDPDYQRQRDGLKDAGYTEEYLTPQNTGAEAMAHILAGQWRDIGYKSEAETVNYLSRTFERIYDQFGVEALQSLRVRTRTGREVKENVIRERSERAKSAAAGSADGRLSGGLERDSRAVSAEAERGAATARSGPERQPPEPDRGLRRGAEEGREARSQESFGQGIPKNQPKTRAEVEGSPEFKRFFRNSKVVDPSGKPMVVYHSTSAPTDFETFSKTKDVGYHFGTPRAADSRSGRFTGEYEPNTRTLPVYLRIENPIELPDIFSNAIGTISSLQRRGILPQRHPEIEAIDLKRFRKEISDDEADQKLREIAVKELEKRGYDGIKYQNLAEDEGSMSWVAFRPEQIKSAVGNKGAFDPENPSVLASVTPRAAKGQPETAKPKSAVFEQLKTRAAAQPKTASARPRSAIFQKLQERAQKQQQPATLLDKVSSFRKAGMLGGIPTHLRNLGGNALWQAVEEGSRGPAALADAVASAFTGRRTITGPSPGAVLRAGREGATKGIAEAKRILRQGQNVDEMAESQRGETKYKNPILNAYVNGIFRTLSAEDAVFRSYALRRAVESRAKAQALTEVRQKTIGRDQVAARTKELIDNPTPDISTGALEDSLVAVFQNENKLSSAISKAKGELGQTGRFIADLFLPYDKTPTNIIARTLESSPLGFGKNVGQVAKALVNKSMTADEQRAFSTTFGRATMGTALLYLGYKLAEKGLLTGSYGDKDEEKRNEAMGKQPGAIIDPNTGRTYAIAALGPLGLLMVTGATIQRESARSLKDESSRFGRLAKSATETVTQLPLLEATEQARKVLTEPVSAEARLGRMASSFIPRTVSDIGTLTDPYQREGKTFRGEIQKQIPGARNFLPEKRTATGEPIEREFSDLVDPFRSRPLKETPLLKEMERLGMGIGLVRQEPEEPEELFRARGDRAQKMFQDAGQELIQHPRFAILTDKQKAQAIRNLQGAASEQSKLKRPRMESLRAAKILAGVIRADRERPRRDQEKIYTPPR